ncbi:MAG: site-2 protease family protein [Oscillospiraceae bacterium]|nr:site-2 protease family protein [Oscillospiraceae bacterium]
MLFQLLRGGFDEIDMAQVMVQVAVLVFIMFICLPVHELAHAWMAKKMGDDTAANHGRLTLNPLRHLDPIGSLMLLAVGFGYAKPVPVNPRRFKSYKKGMALVALAGPVSNILLSMGFMLLSHIAELAARVSQNEFAEFAGLFLWSIAYYNVSLAIFNMLPIPPLDGSRVLDLILPTKISYFIAEYERYIRYGLIALMIFGVLSPVIMALSLWTTRGIDFVISLPFRLIGG